LLTARLEGDAAVPRIATRIVVDSLARLGSNSLLVETARQFPTLVAAHTDADPKDIRRLTEAGCEVAG
jgi:riboflavin biosynthesis pyrimidine reductase